MNKTQLSPTPAGLYYNLNTAEHQRVSFPAPTVH